MSFELEQLREAAEKYTYHDAGTHGAWQGLRIVLETLDRQELQGPMPTFHYWTGDYPGSSKMRA